MTSSIVFGLYGKSAIAALLAAFLIGLAVGYFFRKG